MSLAALSTWQTQVMGAPALNVGRNLIQCPLIGPAPTPGIFLDCGWGTGGFKAIPAGGTLLAHLLATGAHHEISRPFDLSRFPAGRLIDEAAGSGIAH